MGLVVAAMVVVVLAAVVLATLSSALNVSPAVDENRPVRKDPAIAPAVMRYLTKCLLPGLSPRSWALEVLMPIIATPEPYEHSNSY